MPRKKAAPKKAKVAHTLFDHASGLPIELPSDPVIVEAVGKDLDGIVARIKPLDSDSKLALVRRMAKAANSTSRLFNVAVFLLDRETDAAPTLFQAAPEPLAELELI